MLSPCQYLLVKLRKSAQKKKRMPPACKITLLIYSIGVKRAKPAKQKKKKLLTSCASHQTD